MSVGDDAAALFARSMGAAAGQSDPARWELPAPSGRNFHRMVMELLDPDWVTPVPQQNPPMPHPATTLLPSTEVLCARETAGSSDGLFLAVKGGNNGISHNHNDAGSFTAFIDGCPVIIDLGVETYSKATFGPDRYSIWTMRSAFHNVPRINGQEQLPGHEHTATGLESWGTEDAARRTGVSMDLLAAYAPIDGLQSWQSTAELNRDAAVIRIGDAWDGTDICAELTLMLAQEPGVEGESSFMVGGVRISHSPEWHATFEKHDVQDARLIPVWGPSVYRAILRPADGSTGVHEHQLTVSKL